MKKTSAPEHFKFQSKLERIAETMEYYALSVPAKVSLALKTRGPVPVMAKVNDSKSFLVSLFPVGEGRHYLRVKAEIREATEIKEGDRVGVEITVRDRTKEISIPKDLASALRTEDLTEAFKAIPVGAKSFMLRKIEAAAKPETRQKRIEEVVKAAHEKRKKLLKN